eukprot:365122-Chlamydomonas_euryale.AAC.10
MAGGRQQIGSQVRALCRNARANTNLRTGPCLLPMPRQLNGQACMLHSAPRATMQALPGSCRYMPCSRTLCICINTFACYIRASSAAGRLRLGCWSMLAHQLLKHACVSAVARYVHARQALTSSIAAIRPLDINPVSFS